MAKKPLPTPEELRQLLRYEPETGKMFWRARTPEMFADAGHKASHTCASWNTRRAGKEAFTADNGKGYRCGSINDRLVLAHRVAYALLHGEWPESWVDHINGIKSDNRATNLRAATPSQNNQNKSVNSRSRIGYKGVGFDKRCGSFTATIKLDGKRRHLGSFSTAEAAHRAYQRAAVSLFGEFAHAAPHAP